MHVCACVYYNKFGVDVDGLHSFRPVPTRRSDILLPFEGSETGFTSEEAEVLTEMCY